MLENRRVFGEILELMGYTFDTAVCVRDAIEKCQSTRFDLVFNGYLYPKTGAEKPIFTVVSSRLARFEIFQHTARRPSLP